MDLSFSKECIIAETSIIPRISSNLNANPLVQDVEAKQTTSATLQINNTKIYVPVVTLSINDNIKLLENIKQGFKRTISWNKYRSEIITQPKNNKIDYLIDPLYGNFNYLSFHSKMVVMMLQDILLMSITYHE